jgi:glutaredoxin
MKLSSEFAVTLSDDLLAQLRLQAQRLHVPLKWLVASLVCDTLEPFAVPISITESTARPSCHVAWPTNTGNPVKGRFFRAFLISVSALAAQFRSAGGFWFWIRLRVTTMKQPNVAVYGSRSCSDTSRAIGYLETHQIAFELKDLDESPELNKYVADLNNGHMVMPAIQIDNEILINPTDQELAKALQQAAAERE